MTSLPPPRAIRDRKPAPPVVVTVAASAGFVALCAAAVIAVLALAVKFWGWVL